jgi:hypothetical protein
MPFITADEWGANPSKDATEDSHPIGSTLGVTLHWEGPHMGTFPHTACAEKVRGIERYHEYGHGWGDVAYNLLVCPHGYIYEGRGAGVRSAANGDTQSNEDWYAVCYLGGEGDGFTTDGKAGMLEAVTYLRTEGNAGPAVNGHRDHKATACPGDEIYRWLNTTNFDTAPQGDDMALSDNDIDRIARAVWAQGINEIGAKEPQPARRALSEVHNITDDIRNVVRRIEKLERDTQKGHN